MQHGKNAEKISEPAPLGQGRDIEGLAEEEGQLAGRERQRQENLARAQRQHDVLAQQLTALEPPQEAERRAVCEFVCARASVYF